MNIAHTNVLSWPVQTGEVVIPSIYSQIAAEPGDFLVMELPLAPTGAQLYFQTLYRKPLVGGYPSRISNRMSLSFDKAPYLGMFNPAESSGVMDGAAAREPFDIFPLDLTFTQSLQQNNIRFVLLRNYPGAQRFFRWMEPFIEGNLGPPGFKTTDGNLLAWRVAPGVLLPSPSPGKVRFRLGDGWNAGLGKGEDGKLLRLVEQDGLIEIEAGSDLEVNLSLRVTPYIRPQTIEVSLNGQVVGKIDGPAPWKPVSSTLKGLKLMAGKNSLELHSVQGCLVAADYIPESPDRRCIAFAVQEVGIK